MAKVRLHRCPAAPLLKSRALAGLIWAKPPSPGRQKGDHLESSPGGGGAAFSSSPDFA